MPQRRDVPIRELPSELTAQVHERIRMHAVSMVIPTADDTHPLCCSGTLTQVNGIPGILTARHVWDMIMVAQTLTLLVGGEPYWLDPHLLQAFGPVKEEILLDIRARVPDIAFVRIPMPARRDIEASNKVFYSIDSRRRDPEIDLFGERGFWILAGSPQELVDSDTRRVASFLYDTTVERRIEVGDWDYLFVNLDLQQNPSLPRTFVGVSGGGIWRAAFNVTEDESVFTIEKPWRDIVLSGVAFYQTGEHGRQIIGHGPKSLYETLCNRRFDELT